MARRSPARCMNLLARRNLLFQIVQAPVGAVPHQHRDRQSAAYPLAEAADPSAFAQKIRRELTDEQRTLRVYGSEVVIGRLTGDGRAGPAASPQLRRARHRRAAHPAARRLRQGRGARRRRGSRARCEDFVVAGGATEFSVPRIGAYAVDRSDGDEVAAVTPSPARLRGTPGSRARWPWSPPRSRRPCSTRP